MLLKDDLSHIAGYLFILGLVGSVIAGLAVGLIGLAGDVATLVTLGFSGLGLLIGFFMSTSKKIEEEIYVIVVVSLGLLIASKMNVFTAGANTAGALSIGTALNSMVANVATFSAAAIIVLALRTLGRHHMSKI